MDGGERVTKSSRHRLRERWSTGTAQETGNLPVRPDYEDMGRKLISRSQPAPMSSSSPVPTPASCTPPFPCADSSKRSYSKTGPAQSLSAWHSEISCERNLWCQDDAASFVHFVLQLPQCILSNCTTASGLCFQRRIYPLDVPGSIVGSSHAYLLDHITWFSAVRAAKRSVHNVFTPLLDLFPFLFTPQPSGF